MPHFMLHSLDQRISRFGIELEMFPCDHEFCGGSYQDEEYEMRDGCACGGYGDRWDDETNSYEEDEDEPICDGHYVEPSYGDSQAVDVFRRFGLTEHDSQHEYHCQCSMCRYDRTGGSLMAAQNDCTVGIEWVSRIISLDDDRTRDQLLRLPEGVDAMWCESGWRPNGITSCGNHIHVGVDGSGYRKFFNATTVAAEDWLAALTAEVDFTSLADGGCGRIRGYNGGGGQKASDRDRAWGNPVGVYRPGTSWFSRKGSDYWSDRPTRTADGTLELRFWNTPRSGDRVLVHAYTSVALVRWAMTMAIRYRDVTSVAARDRHIENTKPGAIAHQIIECFPRTAPTGTRELAESLIIDTFAA